MMGLKPCLDTAPPLEGGQGGKPHQYRGPETRARAPGAGRSAAPATGPAAAPPARTEASLALGPNGHTEKPRKQAAPDGCVQGAWQQRTYPKARV